MVSALIMLVGGTIVGAARRRDGAAPATVARASRGIGLTRRDKRIAPNKSNVVGDRNVSLVANTSTAVRRATRVR